MKRPSLTTRPSWPIGAAILAIGLAGSSLLIATAPRATPVEREEKAWPVSTLEVQPAALAPRFTTFATVEGAVVAHLQSSIDAPVRAVHVHTGDRVSANQVLVELDDRELALEVERRKAQLGAAQAELDSIEIAATRLAAETAHQRRLAELARAKLARYQTLFKDGMVARARLDDAQREAAERAIALARHGAELDDLPNRRRRQQAAMSEARSRLQDARLDLSRCVIRAPFAGPVLAVNVAPGDRPRTNVLVSVADQASLELRAAIPKRYQESIRRHLAAGRSVSAEAAAKGGRYVLSRLAGNVAPGRSGIDAYFRAASPAMLLQIGEVVTLDVELPAEPDVIAVPVPALYENDRVYVVKDERLQAIRVRRIGEHRDADGRLSILVRSPELTGVSELLVTALPNAMTGLRVAPIRGAKGHVPTS